MIPEAIVKTVLLQHFPEYVSQSCLCGMAIETYDIWVSHVLDEMGDHASET